MRSKPGKAQPTFDETDRQTEPARNILDRSPAIDQRRKGLGLVCRVHCEAVEVLGKTGFDCAFGAVFEHQTGHFVVLGQDFFFGEACHRLAATLMRNALAYVPKGQNTVVAAAIRQVFLQPDHAAATQVWRQVADQLRARWPKLGTCMDEAEHDVLAYMTFPEQHRVKLHSTNPLERLNKVSAVSTHGTDLRL